MRESCDCKPRQLIATLINHHMPRVIIGLSGEKKKKRKENELVTIFFSHCRSRALHDYADEQCCTSKLTGKVGEYENVRLPLRLHE